MHFFLKATTHPSTCTISTMTLRGIGRYGIVCGNDREVTKYIWLRDDEDQTEFELQRAVAECTHQVPRVISIDKIRADATTLPSDVDIRMLHAPLTFYRGRTDREGEKLDTDTTVAVLHTTADICTVMTELGVRWTATNDLMARGREMHVTQLADRVLCVAMDTVPDAVTADDYLARANKKHRLQVYAQVLAFLTRARHSVPGFRHNDLHLQNVLITPATAPSVLCADAYDVPVAVGDPLVKVIDFGLGCSDRHQATSWADFGDECGLCDAGVAVFDLYRFFECLLASVTGLSLDEVRLAYAASRPGGVEITLSVSLQRRLLADPACAGHVAIDGRGVPYGHVTPASLLGHESLRSVVLRRCAVS